MKNITILLVEDHVVVREGFRNLLISEAGFELLGEAENGRQAVAMAVKLRPDVVVMDIAMPELNGLEATRQILKTLPATKVVILSAHSDYAYVEQALDVGATGFLLKHNSAHMLFDAIREVYSGAIYLSPSIARHRDRNRQQALDREGRIKAQAVRLTSRETEVLQLVAEGRANKQIGADLGISVKTVEKHRDHLMHKLDIHDTAGLTRYAMAAGIIEGGVNLTIV